MKETLYVKLIKDSYKKDKEGKVIHSRHVEIADSANKLKVIFSDDYGDLPSQIRNLDENTDLWAEVDIDIELRLASRQRKISSFKEEVKKTLEKEGIEVEVLNDD